MIDKNARTDKTGSEKKSGETIEKTANTRAQNNAVFCETIPEAIKGSPPFFLSTSISASWLNM